MTVPVTRERQRKHRAGPDQEEDAEKDRAHREDLKIGPRKR